MTLQAHASHASHAQKTHTYTEDLWARGRPYKYKYKYKYNTSRALSLCSS